MSIQTRTLLRCSSRQVTMSYNLRFREQLMKTSQYINDSFCLLRCASVAWLAMLIQSTLIADTNRTTVVRSCMSTHFKQEAMLRHRTILSDIKVVADVVEATALVVTAKLFHTIVMVASGSRAMQDKESYGIGRHHQFAVLHSGKESALIAHQLLTDRQWEFFFNHSRKSTFNT